MTIWEVWYTHLRDVLDKVAEGLQIPAEGVRAYELSFIWNVSLVDNQLLHHDCASPTIPWVARGRGAVPSKRGGRFWRMTPTPRWAFTPPLLS